MICGLITCMCQCGLCTTTQCVRRYTCPCGQGPRCHCGSRSRIYSVRTTFSSSPRTTHATWTCTMHANRSRDHACNYGPGITQSTFTTCPDDSSNLEFVRQLFSEEGKGEFSTRINVLGHAQVSIIPISQTVNPGPSMFSKAAIRRHSTGTWERS